MSRRDGEERESRFAHLLQPNRDLAANWSLDVARELEAYLAELSLTPPFGDCHNSLNFAEAALLIQGSIQIYSRKVEYLYALVLQALEFISQKKQTQQEKTSIQEDGKDADVDEDKEDDFLNLDDVPEEANIDIDDETAGLVTAVVKPPASLLVVEGDNLDVSGDVGELASYQISTSSLHRDFLLLDPCDANAVDEYLMMDGAHGREETPGCPSSVARRRTPRGNFSTPGRKGGVAQDVDNSKGNGSALRNAASGNSLPTSDKMDSWHTNFGGEEMWDDTCIVKDAGLGGRNEGGKHVINQEIDDDAEVQVDGGFEEEEEDDPWVPLNPHELGTLLVKPYRRGRQCRKKRSKQHPDALTLEFPLVTRNGTTYPEFAKSLAALEPRRNEARCTKNNGWFLPIFEKLRCSFNVHGSTSFDVALDHQNGSEEPKAHDESNSENGEDDAFDQFEDAHAPSFMDNIVSQDWSQDYLKDNGLTNDTSFHDNGLDEEMNFEALCRAHLDAILKSLADSEVRTELATRVSNWKQKIEKSLADNESHPPFDIHVYGEKVLDKLSADETVGEKSFANLVEGQERHEVARTFASLLQLVNNGNVSLEKGFTGNSSLCFTKQNSFSVKLLNCHKNHEEMLHYRAPSKAAKNAAIKPLQKFNQIAARMPPLESNNLDANICASERVPNLSLFSPPCKLLSNKKTSSSKRLAGNGKAGLDLDLNNLSPSDRKPIGSGLTPEGKRRRRRRPLRSVEARYT
eukprot:c28585_g1_i1 orf=145-2379(+)